MAVNGGMGDPRETANKSNKSNETDEVEPVEESDQEYEDINTALDEISNCLDALEQQNDTLNAKLRDLLESNRQIRSEIQQEASNLPEEGAS